MLSELGAEFEILRALPLEDIRRVSGTRIAEGIRRLRGGHVERIPGFDGEYGVIRLFSTDELENTEGQMSFFDMIGADAGSTARAGSGTECADRNGAGEDNADLTGRETAEAETESAEPSGESHGGKPAPILNPEQLRAVTSGAARIAVKAGPGTGKTKTLVSRLKYLLENRRVRPSEITAVTFTKDMLKAKKRGIRLMPPSKLEGSIYSQNQDMESDVAALLSRILPKSKSLRSLAFHSICFSHL